MCWERWYLDQDAVQAVQQPKPASKRPTPEAAVDDQAEDALEPAVAASV